MSELTPVKLLSSILSTPGKLLGTWRSSSPAPTSVLAAASGDAGSENADKNPQQHEASASKRAEPNQKAQQQQSFKEKQEQHASPAGGLQGTLLQQTAGWEPEKHAALERFFNRPRAAHTAVGASTSQNAAQPTAAVYGAFYNIIRNPPKSNSAREVENGPLRHSTRSSRYNPYARPPNRTGAGHVNSGNALYSSSGSRRPLTPMPLIKPGGALAAAADEPSSDDRQQQQDRLGPAAGTTGVFGRQAELADGPIHAPAGHTGSMFGNIATAAPTPASGALFPNVGRSGGVAAGAGSGLGGFSAASRPPAFSGTFGLGGAVKGGSAAAGGLNSGSRPGSSSDLPALLAGGLPAASQPVLGLPRVKPPPGRAPLMGAKRGAAGRQGSTGGARGSLGGAVGSNALRPMRSTPLKITHPSAGSKRGAEMHGPSALEVVAQAGTGHKRLRMASTPGLRAMSGLGSGSPGNKSGLADGQQNDEVLPVVQATSVAETILDTMRSLEKGGSVLARSSQQSEQAGSGPPPLDRLDGSALRTQLFATPKPQHHGSMVAAASAGSSGAAGLLEAGGTPITGLLTGQGASATPTAWETPGADGTPVVGPPGKTPWARKPGQAASEPPAAPGSIPKHSAPGSFFTPPPAREEASKADAGTARMPHISPITPPWDAAVRFSTPGAIPGGREQGTAAGMQQFVFGSAGTGDIATDQAIAAATAGLGNAVMDRIPVRQFTFGQPTEVALKPAAAAEAPKQQRARVSWEDMHEQQQQQPRNTAADLPEGNPLLAFKFAKQQQAASAAAGSGGFGWGQQTTEQTTGDSTRAATPAAAGLPKWGTAAAAAARLASGVKSATGAASPSSPVFALDNGGAGLLDGDVLLPPGCDPSMLAEQVKKAAEVPLPPDSEDEDTDVQQQHKHKQQESPVIGKAPSPAAEKPAAGAAVLAAKMPSRAGDSTGKRKKGKFSVFDAVSEEDEDEIAVAEVQANQQTQDKQQQQGEADEPERRRKKRASRSPAADVAGTDNISSKVPAFGASAKQPEQQQQDAVPFGSPFGASKPADAAAPAAFGFGSTPAAPPTSAGGFGAAAAGSTGGFTFGTSNTAGADKPASTDAAVTAASKQQEEPPAMIDAKLAEQRTAAAEQPAPAASLFGFSAAPTVSASGTADKSAAAGSSAGVMFGVTPAVSTPAPAIEKEPAASASDKPTTGFMFGAQASTSAATSISSAAAAGSSAVLTFSFGAPAASTPAPAADTPAAELPVSPAAGGFAFGASTSSTPGGFGANASATPSTAGFTFGSGGVGASSAAPAATASSAPASGFGFSFGATPAASTPAPCSSSALAFGTSSSASPAPSFTFGSAKAETSAAAAASATPAFSFGASSASAPAATSGAAAGTPAVSFAAGGAQPSSAAAGFGSTGSGTFGTTTSGGFGGFGATQAASAAAGAAPGFSFGSTTPSSAAAPTSSGAGAPGGFSFGAAGAAPAPSPFGAPAAPAAQDKPAGAPGFTFGAAASPAPAAGGFGAPASSGGASGFTFGAAPAATAAPAPVSFGGFGAQQQQQQPAPFGQPQQQPVQQPVQPFAFGAAAAAPQQPSSFGTSPPAAVAGGFAFGAQPPQQQQQQQPAGFGGFGAQPSPQQQQQPPAFGGFGAGGSGGQAAPAFGMGSGGMPGQDGGFTIGAMGQQQQQGGNRRIVKARRKGR